MRLLKKGSKAFFAVVLSLLIAMSCMIMAGAAQDDTESANAAPDYVTNSSDKALWAEGYSKTETNLNIDAVKWFEKDNKYYWFLPSSADLSNLIVYHNFTSVTVNGTAITSGESYSLFEDGKQYTVTADGKNYTLVVQKANGIASMFITTETGSMDAVHADKEHKEPGNMVLVDYNGDVSYDNALDYIKGRGNTTWRNIAKKPYNIKLAKKTALLGMSKSKKWCLLANGQEHSMVRNRFAYDLANEVGINFAPESYFLDLYSNGEYLGTYQLTEKVDLGADNLVKIKDLQSETEDLAKAATGNDDLSIYSRYNSNNRRGYNIPYNPEDITGGYLIEYVAGNEEPSCFVTKKGQAVDVKSPEFCSAEQINYIADFVQDMEDAIYSSTGYNSKGKHYTEYIDEESAALMYLLQELTVNIDGGISSCFFYKESNIDGDGKIHAGPCWDFDVAMGNLATTKDGVLMTSYDQWFAKNAYLWNPKNVHTIFAQLCQHEDFYETASKLWRERYVPALNIAFGNATGTGRLKSLSSYDAEVSPSSVMNYTRWKLTDNLLVPSAGTTQDSQFSYLVNWLNNRTSFMNTGLLDLASSKENAKLELDRVIAQNKAEGYSDEIIAKMEKAAATGKANIEKATTTDEVSSALEAAKQEIDSYAENIIYYDNTKTNWENVYLYTYGGTTVLQWPGVKMTNMGNGIFKYTLPKADVNVIFTNGLAERNGKAQTADLKIQGNNYIYQADPDKSNYDSNKQADIYDGQWSKYVPTPVYGIYGDMDGSGDVALEDAVIMQKYIAKSITFNDDQQKYGDLDGSGDIELEDAVILQKYLAHSVSKLPVKVA